MGAGAAPGRAWSRLGWFVGLWAVSALAVALLAYALRWVILGLS